MLPAHARVDSRWTPIRGSTYTLDGIRLELEKHNTSVDEVKSTYTYLTGDHLCALCFFLSGLMTSSDSHSSPQKVRLLCGKRVVKMAAGLEHSLALTESDDMYSFGDNLRYNYPFFYSGSLCVCCMLLINQIISYDMCLFLP